MLTVSIGMKHDSLAVGFMESFFDLSGKLQMLAATARDGRALPPFSLPHVYGDNPYSQALFRTLKHAPWRTRVCRSPTLPLPRWVACFVEWYNGQNRHSAIRYVRPDERHWEDARGGRRDAARAALGDLVV
jgi:hypothetical protein